MRQYFEQLPRELDQAAYVDGANDFQIFTKVIMPLSGPALAVLGINSFIASWNDLYMPLVLTTSKEMRTVQVGLAMFQKINGVKWPLIMAASAIVGIPVIIAFLFFQKKIIAGITDGALKG
jgi:multiple sugar transport system permease protein